MQFHVIIPARYASTRLPGKPLRLLADKPIIQHVYEQASLSQASSVIIATDDERIQQTAEAFGAEVCMTSNQHSSGTERLAEVIEKKKLGDEAIIINLQGDEPMMPTACLDQVAELLQSNPECKMASLCELITNIEDVFDPNVVKVVLNKSHHAIYFSRAPIPWDRDVFATSDKKISSELSNNCFRHIGLYAYRAGFVKEYISMTTSPLEKLESLEQLRVLWHGFDIAMGVAIEPPGQGIDTEQDLLNAQNYFINT
ncbi:MAG: 3-deoxy-manno-octulosonate cytidylyltransferase [Gammaproteobacteria bacterium]|nr:3-deoxy-manno-octulosonate cytidylyltransferase [Gammaproteobacteria bacterium]